MQKYANNETLYRIITNTRATFQQEQCQQTKDYYINKTDHIYKKNTMFILLIYESNYLFKKKG